MAAMDRAIKKEFIRYTKKHYLAEAKEIIRKAEELFPVLYAKAPDIGGKENLMSYNLDLMILSASFYEASDHRIEGEAITEMAKSIFGKYRFLRHIINVNRPWQMKLMGFSFCVSDEKRRNKLMTDSMEKKINNEAMNNEELESVNGGEASDYAAFLIAIVN